MLYEEKLILCSLYDTKMLTKTITAYAYSGSSSQTISAFMYNK